MNHYSNIFNGKLGIIAVGLALSPVVNAAQFVDVAGSAGVAALDVRGTAWGDFNNDSCVDLFVNQETSAILYANNCDGTFTDVTAAAGMATAPGGWGATWADYDEDGNLDLYVTGGGANLFYVNNGDGTFTEMAAAAGIDDPRTSTGASWADYDADGDLDLFVANRFDTVQEPDISDRLYQNNGDGTFTDVAAAAGIAGASDRKSFTGIWFDYDQNNTLDLYLAVDFGDDVLYTNNGDGTFTDVSAIAGIGDPQHGMGVSVGDINHDGCLDVFSSNNTQGEPGDAEHGPSALYVNNCDGTFTNQTAVLLEDRAVVEWGGNFIDYDNDADVDLSIVAGGMLSSGEPNVLYENDGCGGFFNPTEKLGVGNSGAAFASSWADFDNDGDLDWYVGNVTGGPSVLYRNDGPVGNYLKVKLNGIASNIDGIGARVEVTSGGRTQVRTITAGLSFASSEELAAFFGLGVKDTADKVTVLWPMGVVTEVTDIAANQTIVIEETFDTPFTTGSVTGFTFNPSGTIEPDVLVDVRNEANVIVAKTTSDASGAFLLENIPVGIYRLTANKPNFRFNVVSDLEVSAGMVTVQDIALRVQ